MNTKQKMQEYLKKLGFEVSEERSGSLAVHFNQSIPGIRQHSFFYVAAQQGGIGISDDGQRTTIFIDPDGSAVKNYQGNFAEDLAAALQSLGVRVTPPPKRRAANEVPPGVAHAALVAAGGQNLDPAEPDGSPNGHLVAGIPNQPEIRQV